ncbi:hypothetical protein GRAN_1400 [Granulicella sibirica]|uniref:Uncharacterized protein n=1 Tax=Granulicella sibirica TaxID=2479048 RepID=A0A4Q0T641_9BACT|nr:hypothetical protein GRAN_1400 [Granulicella sibirica]
MGTPWGDLEAAFVKRVRPQNGLVEFRLVRAVRPDIHNI